MKKILLLILIATALSCNSRSDRQSESSGRNAEENVEENSGENISPQLEDSTDRFNVDSISSSNEAQQEKKNELEDGKSGQ